MNAADDADDIVLSRIPLPPWSDAQERLMRADGQEHREYSALTFNNTRYLEVVNLFFARLDDTLRANGYRMSNPHADDEAEFVDHVIMQGQFYHEREYQRVLDDLDIFEGISKQEADIVLYECVREDLLRLMTTRFTHSVAVVFAVDAKRIVQSDVIPMLTGIGPWERKHPVIT